MKSSLNYSDRQENLSNNGKKISDEVLTDYLCCWLIVIGVLLIMKQLFRFENPIHMIIIRSGIVLSITALLTRFRRYTIFIIPAVLLYAVFLLWATDNLASFFEYITGIIEWWVDLFPSHSYYNTPFNVSLVLWIISAFVCLIVVILVRRIHIFGVIAALIALLVFVVLVNGFRNNLLGISFISIGIFPLLIRSNYIKLELHLDDLHFSRRRVMFSGLAICLIFALASNLIVPQDTSKWVNPALSGLYYRIKYSQSFFSKGPFSLQSSGLQPNVDRLGGNVSLNHTLILKVKTDIQVPLKCNVYSLYTGKGWESVSVDEYPLNDFDNELFKDAFDLDMPIDKNGSNPLKNAMHDAETEITMVYGGYSVFSSGRLSSLISADKQAEFMFNSKSEIFSKKLLPTAFTYSYQSTILNKQTNNIAKRIDNIEISSEDDKYDTIKQLYLQLPPELPEPVYIKAREATENSLSDYEKMVELERYLKTNYEYTLKPGNPPKDEDFVNSFLVNGRGYCTYFASAMAVMARTLGVPSRFVIGYGTVPSGNDYASYSDNAHAWVECYFRGVGWIPFDPTAGTEYSPPIPAASGNKTPGTRTQNTGNSQTPTKTTDTKASTSLVTTTTASNKQTNLSTTFETDKPQGKSNTLLWLGISAAIMLILIITIVMFRVLRQLGAYRLTAVNSRFKDNAEKADYYYTDLLRQLSLLNIAPLTGETIRQHGQRADFMLEKDQDAPKIGDRLQSSFNTVMNLRYGDIQPTDNEIEQMAAVHDNLELRLVKSLSQIRYFLVRLLFA